jgi:hypothetical protein
MREKATGTPTREEKSQVAYCMGRNAGERRKESGGNKTGLSSK